MNLDLLPYRTASTAENMAADFLLMKCATGDHARFRHYGWRAPAFTFGYSQKITDVRAQLHVDGLFDICRRPTGGGIVDHRDDWTYALILPRGHALEEMRATQSYRLVHEALAAALAAQGVPAVLKPAVPQVEPDDHIGFSAAGAAASGQTAPPQSGLPAGVCFQRAETFDVCHAATGEKIAGAAQKRAKQGMLFQGSIWKAAVGATIDWERYGDDFASRLATMLGAEAAPAPWPEEIGDGELAVLTEHYASPEWNEAR
ncbi:MAG: lipoate--protein ligase family protein [Verrucomicrobiota bacterium]